MHKPLELPFRVRVWHFIRGLLFYNTVYWRRASDGLNPPKLSPRERLLHQPSRNLEIIRPRENPRSNISVARGAQVSVPHFDGSRPSGNDFENATPTEVNSEIAPLSDNYPEIATPTDAEPEDVPIAEPDLEVAAITDSYAEFAPIMEKAPESLSVVSEPIFDTSPAEMIVKRRRYRRRRAKVSSSRHSGSSGTAQKYGLLARWFGW